MTNSVGIVETKFLHIDEPLTLDSGKVLPQYDIAYETYGELNEDKSNAVLIFHALTGDSHVTSSYDDDDSTPGWWDSLVGCGKEVDTDKYFVICANT